jgi:hypothetical protein
VKKWKYTKISEKVGFGEILQKIRYLGHKKGQHVATLGLRCVLIEYQGLPSLLSSDCRCWIAFRSSSLSDLAVMRTDGKVLERVWYLEI